MAYLLSTPILQVSALLLLYFALSSTWSQNFNWIDAVKSFGDVMLLLAFISGFGICARLVSGFLPALVILLIFSAAVSASYSIVLDFGLHFRPYDDLRISPMGRLFNPVIGATAYGMAALFSLHCLLQSRDALKQVGWSLLTVLLLVVVYMTGAIAVWSALALAVVLAVGLRSGMSFNKLILLLAGLAAVIGLLFAGCYFFYPELLIQLFPRTTSFRPEIWRVVIDLVIEKNPLIGFGQLDSGHLTVAEMQFQHAHSIYLAAFYYGGLIGFGLLAALIVMSFRVVISASFALESADQHENSHPLQMYEKLLIPTSIPALPNLALVALLYACVVFALDGDHLLSKIDLIWIVFWLPIALCALINNGRKSL